MDILDRIKQFINESIQSLFERQKEEFSLTIKKENNAAVSSLMKFINDKVDTSERDKANMMQMIYSLNENVGIISNRLDVIQKNIDELKKHQAELLSTECHLQPAPPKQEATTYYSKMVDSPTPLGFKIDNLKKDEEGCAFKITIKNDTEGEYEFVCDKDIQQEILAAFNPLISSSSIYDNVPQNPTNISVVQPGTVVKENNVLKIVNKQKIEIS